MQATTPPKSPSNQSVAGHPKGDKRFKVLDITLKRSQYRQDALIEVLHKAQESFGYLEDDVLIYVARQLKLPLSRVYGVATFYHLFSLKPSGVHNCIVCMGTACYVKGGDKVMAALETSTGIKAGETTPDNLVSLVTARCVGACGIAPVVIFDGKVGAQQTPESVTTQIQQWKMGSRGLS
ncbi:MAG: bidirectional hydrogenase complex protein HoxE [Oscillatoriales cyanobacterium RM2_1_1]|nr:bidirectional hydrogenase complex protein HoxE [Oscillatoriales cyanobacterium SM2_3_0]NJO46485.1 bidirectional hydrogenase complex protein HoxE [Oscillatoriales cyanobacterium RM2_1_1]